MKVVSILTSLRAGAAICVMRVVTASDEPEPAIVYVNKTVGTGLHEALAFVAFVVEVTGSLVGNRLGA